MCRASAMVRESDVGFLSGFGNSDFGFLPRRLFFAFRYVTTPALQPSPATDATVEAWMVAYLPSRLADRVDVGATLQRLLERAPVADLLDP